MEIQGRPIFFTPAGNAYIVVGLKCVHCGGVAVKMDRIVIVDLGVMMMMGQCDSCQNIIYNEPMKIIEELEILMIAGDKKEEVN